MLRRRWTIDSLECFGARFECWRDVFHTLRSVRPKRQLSEEEQFACVDGLFIELYAISANARVFLLGIARDGLVPTHDGLFTFHEEVRAWYGRRGAVPGLVSALNASALSFPCRAPRRCTIVTAFLATRCTRMSTKPCASAASGSGAAIGMNGSRRYAIAREAPRRTGHGRKVVVAPGTDDHLTGCCSLVAQSSTHISRGLFAVADWTLVETNCELVTFLDRWPLVPLVRRELGLTSPRGGEHTIDEDFWSMAHSEVALANAAQLDELFFDSVYSAEVQTIRRVRSGAPLRSLLCDCPSLMLPPRLATANHTMRDARGHHVAPIPCARVAHQADTARVAASLPFERATSPARSCRQLLRF